MMNYLKVTGYRLGYVINFKHERLQWRRVVKYVLLSVFIGPAAAGSVVENKSQQSHSTRLLS